MLPSLVKKTALAFTATASLLFAPITTSAQQLSVDENLPTYKPVEGVSGNIKSVGSDTMNNLMTLWAEGFQEKYPGVQVEIEGKGSSTAPPALISGTASFGPMSRQMKDAEIDAFEKKFGYKPTLLRTGIDMLAVYVNKSNPVEGMTLAQVDAAFSQTRKGGYDTNVRVWGDLGVEGDMAKQPISLYGRNAASGTYGYFKKYALYGGDFKADVKQQPGSSSVVQGIASDVNAMGYSGIGYMTADVKAVPLAIEEGEEFFPTDPEYAYTGEYPLTRFLYVYINVTPGEELDPLRREFVKYIFSKEGQENVIKDGYLPISAEIARQTLKSVNIEPDF